MKFKSLGNLEFNLPLFLGGVIIGLFMSALLMLPNKSLIVELDLNKIIQAYSAIAAISSEEVATVNKEFKQKFNHAMSQISPKTIIVSKGHLLSKHELPDYTEKFLQGMGVNKTDVKS
jgi:hypothetical protein